MQDMMTVWTHEGRQKRRKYYLMMHLPEAHHIFCDLHTSPNKQKVIGFSKFCSLRPKNVLLTGDTPQYQCECMIHENFFLKREAMGQNYNRYFIHGLWIKGSQLPQIFLRLEIWDDLTYLVS